MRKWILFGVTILVVGYLLANLAFVTFVPALHHVRFNVEVRNGPANTPVRNALIKSAWWSDHAKPRETSS